MRSARSAPGSGPLGHGQGDGRDKVGAKLKKVVTRKSRTGASALFSLIMRRKLVVFALLGALSQASHATNWLEVENNEQPGAKAAHFWGFIQPRYTHNSGGAVEGIAAPKPAMTPMRTRPTTRPTNSRRPPRHAPRTTGSPPTRTTTSPGRNAPPAAQSSPTPPPGRKPACHDLAARHPQRLHLSRLPLHSVHHSSQ